MNKSYTLEVKAELMNSQNILNCNQLMVLWVDFKSSTSGTTCCKLSTGVDNVVLPTVNNAVLHLVINVVLHPVNNVVDKVVQP